jgi:hypothetical protein
MPRWPAVSRIERLSPPRKFGSAFPSSRRWELSPPAARESSRRGKEGNTLLPCQRPEERSSRSCFPVGFCLTVNRSSVALRETDMLFAKTRQLFGRLQFGRSELGQSSASLIHVDAVIHIRLVYLLVIKPKAFSKTYEFKFQFTQDLIRVVLPAYMHIHAAVICIIFCMLKIFLHH